MSATSRHKEKHLSQSLEGRQSAGRQLGVSAVLFKPTTLISLILIGFFAFGALIVLGGFAKDLRKAPPGQATPRSVSAVGYQALAKYLGDLNYDVTETIGVRESSDRDNRLIIYTPSNPTARLNRALEDTGEEVRLVVLPKWSIRQMVPTKEETGRKGWARKTANASLFYAGAYNRLLDDLPVIRRHKDPSVNTQVVFTTKTPRGLPKKLAPDFEGLQYFDLDTAWKAHKIELRKTQEAEREESRRKMAEEAGEKYEPKSSKKKKSKKKTSEDKDALVDEAEIPEPITLPEHEVLLKIDGRAVLIRLEDTQTYVLSEPDLINTMAFQTQSNAYLSGAVIDEVIRRGELNWQTVDFDLTLHGFEANRNIVKLMVTPPFLAATLCLLAAGGLVAWQGFNRFGDPARVRPDYAQGPVSLAETAAEFMEIADRAHGTGDAYAGLIRRQVIDTLGFGARRSDHTDTLLDAREARLKIEPRYAPLKHAISTADPQTYPQYARALTQWRDAMTRTDTDLGQEDTSL